MVNFASLPLLCFCGAYHCCPNLQKNDVQLLFKSLELGKQSLCSKRAISPPDLKSCRISGVSTRVLNRLSAAEDRKLDTLCSRAPCDPSALISCKHKAVSQALPPGPDSRWAFQRRKNVNSQPATTPLPPVGMATAQWGGAFWRDRSEAFGGGEQVGTQTMHVHCGRTAVGWEMKCCRREVKMKNEAVEKEEKGAWLPQPEQGEASWIANLNSDAEVAADPSFVVKTAPTKPRHYQD